MTGLDWVTFSSLSPSVGLARCGLSHLELFRLEVGGMRSQREAEVLDLGVRTEAGAGKAAIPRH